MAVGSEGPPPVLHITTYRSPAGAFAFTVDPSHLHGQDGSSCTMESDGRRLWTQKYDFTFWEAGVTDEGVVAGYGYTHGWRGFHWDRRQRGHGDFIVAILNPDGTVRTLNRTPRTESRALHTPPDPTARGFFVDGSGDRLVLRFPPEGGMLTAGERWEIYRLSDGTRLPELSLAEPPKDAAVQGFSMVMEAHSIPGTDLTLVLWSKSVWREGGAVHGTRLSLLDRSATEVWSWDRPEEFQNAPQPFSLWTVEGRLTGVDGRTPRTFWYRSFAAQSRIGFTAAADPASKGGWHIAETGRGPDRVSTRSWQDARLDLPHVALEARGQVTLGGEGGDPPSLGVFSFEFDSAGRTGFVTAEGDQARFVLLNQDGSQAKSIPLGLGRDPERPLPPAVWIGGDRWAAVQGSYADKGEARAFLIDTAAGSVRPLENFSSPNPDSSGGITGGGEAGFAVMGDYRSDSVTVFTPEGARRWQADTGMAQSVAMRENGEVGVLIGIQNLIRVFDTAGREVRTIDLAKCLGGEPNYVADLAPDVDGGWILHDFDGTPPVYRLGPEGDVRASFEPRYPDGRTFTLHGGVRAAPDGRLWTSDRAALLRLNEAGVVDKVVGRAPDAESLDEMCAFTIDHRGLLYAVDGRSGNVHIFDERGKPQRLLKPEPTDFRVGGGLGSITVAGDGAIYYRTDSIGGLFGRARYLKFTAGGTRAGFQQLVGGEVSEDWYFRPGGGERLVVGYERAWLLNAEGDKTRVIERRADRKWLAHPGKAAVAPDGAFAIVADSPGVLESDVAPSVTIFSPTGEALRTLELPRTFMFARVALAGGVACVLHEDLVILLSAASGAAGQFTLPAGKERWLTPFASPDERELWLVDHEAKQLTRYAVPAL